MAHWAICTTLKAPTDEVLAFVAHHLSLGAARIWIHFDDPADPAIAAVARIPKVTPVPCDAAYWQAVAGGRPDAHQDRQTANIQRCYAACQYPWLAHIDGDEFLWPTRRVDRWLNLVDDATPCLRIRPYEALWDAGLPDDIFTARTFRGALQPVEQRGMLRRIYGPYAPALRGGMLSHSAGKCFFRTGVPGLRPRLHSAFIDGARIAEQEFEPGLALLHFHAQNRAAWLAALPFRLAHGAYRGNAALVAVLADPDAAAPFFDRVQAIAPHRRDLLREEGALIEADLGLRDKVAALRAQ